MLTKGNISESGMFTDESRRDCIQDYYETMQTSNILVLRWSRSLKKHLFTKEDIENCCKPFGVIVKVLRHEGAKRCAIVEFEQDASLAMEQLNNSKPEELIGRTLHVKFGKRKDDVKTFSGFLGLKNVSSVLFDRVENPIGDYVPGLKMYYNFVSEREETELINLVDTTDQWQKLSCRRVQHFGYAFDYTSSRCDEKKPLGKMPDEIQGCVDRMPDSMERPDQITANEYLPGDGIAPHIDTHSAFKGGIASLSLGSQSVMDFKNTKGEWKSVLLPRRSLLVMTGEARFAWTHSIQNRKTDLVDGIQVSRNRRISLSFRTLSTDPCECAYPVHCDTQSKKMAAGEEPHKKFPTKMEQEYVHQFYETIATHFSKTRYAPWPKVEAFVKALPSGSILADIGCGNGKYMACVNDHCVSFGGDYSASLVDICRTRGFDVATLDAIIVPYRDQCADAVLSIAVLHHLSTLEHRLCAIRELVRILRINGVGLLYAWAQEQEQKSKRQFDTHVQDIMVPWNLQSRFAKDTNEQDNKETVVQRYCHVYHKHELDQLFATIPNVVVEDSYYDNSNWCIQFRRTA